MTLPPFFLIGLVLAGAWAQECTPNANYTCANPQPTFSDNLAFPAFSDDDLAFAGDKLVRYFSAADPVHWQSAIDRLKYHVSLYYLPCVADDQEQPITSALRHFRWDSQTVTFDHACCESGYIEICMDAPSQVKMTAFAKSVVDFLISQGIAIPDLLDTQPPRHVTIGLVAPNYNMTHAFTQGAIPSFIPVTMVLDTLYFGTAVYVSNDFLEPGPGAVSNYLYIAIAGVFLIFLLPQVRKCIGDCCPCCRDCCLACDSCCCCSCCTSGIVRPPAPSSSPKVVKSPGGFGV